MIFGSNRKPSKAVDSIRSLANVGIRLLSIAIAFPVSAAIEAAPEWVESAPAIRFESRDWAEDVMAEAQGNSSIAVEGGRLLSNTTWAPPKTHLVASTVYVPSGITLTITAGAVVKYCPGTTIKVEDGAKLVVNGADGNDVILTAANDNTIGEPIAGFGEEQIAFGGIRLQSSAATFTDNGWLETRGFDYGAFPGISVNATEAVRNGGMAYVPFTLSGSSRSAAFSVDWEAVAGTAKFGEDYTLASGTISWTGTSQGTKTLAIPINAANITGEERTFTVRIKAARCANVVRREATVKIVEREGLTLEWADEWVESAPPIGFDSREWAEDVMAEATNAQSIAIEGGRLQSNAVWNASLTHLVLNTVYVPSGITLTITAGAVVKYCPGTTIKVEDGGKLVVNGADGNDVILTAANDATVGEPIAGFDAEQSIAFDGIRLQSSAASFTDNGWLQTRGFTWGSYPSVSLNDATAFRSAGEALLPVTVGGTTRNQSFTVEWEAIDGTAKLGEDYTLASGRITWAKSGDGTKTLRIPLVADHLVGSNTEFKVRLTVSRGANIARGECTVTIKELDTLDLAWGEAESNPPIRFESREWMEPVLAAVEGNSAIVIEGGRLPSNTTWGPEVTHLVLNDVIVPSGITLTITAGTVVKYGPGTTIKVEDGGKLVVNGADGNDVILTAADDNTIGEPIAGFGEEPIAFDGIRLQSSSASFTDNGWLQTRGFNYDTYPTLTIHNATANRKAGMIYLPVTVSGSRNQAFTVDWTTEDETAQFARDYTTRNSGRLTWSKSGDGTKYITIPLAKDETAGTNRTFKVKFVTARCCNVARGEAVATIAEFENGGIESNDVVEWAPSDPSPEFAVREGIKLQPIFLNDVERVQYSGKWQTYDTNEAAVLRVTLETDNGATVLKEASPSETGAFDLDLRRYPVGYYTLKHEILNDLGETLATMQKTFSIADDEDVVLHGGVLTSNEVWSADKVHVVYETVVVPSIYTIFIEPGAIVKFMTGTGIDISQGGAFFANRIVFTHINDDTVGGDTLNDGFTVAPPMDAYFLSGAFTFGDDTELRGITQNNALTGTIATQKTLSRGSTYRVSGTLTIASGGSLTIPPGTVLKMEDKAAIVVNSGATLNAIGTRASPIVITSIRDDSVSGDTNGDGGATIPQPGDWEEIKNNGGTLNLAFVTALYGGYGQYSNQGDAIIRTANGKTTMDSCVVKHSNLRLVGRTGGTVYAENCTLEDGRWGIDGAVTFVNGVIANCNTGANGATLKNAILWKCDTFISGGAASNCAFWNVDGNRPQSIAFDDATGNIWGDPLFVDPVNGDFRVKEGSPCVDAADSAVAPEYDFYGQPRITLGGSPSSATETNEVVLVGQLADIGICEVMPRDVVSDIDLVPQSVRTTTNAVPGQLLFVKWEIANVGGREVDAAWRDTISLVSESGREVVLGDKTTASRIGVGGSVFCSGYFTVPAISEGTWYPKVNVNSYHDIFEGSLAANNALTGERAVTVGLEALDPSISREGVINGGTPTVLKLAFGENSDNRMVRFDVPAGVTATWGFGFMPGGSRSVATASGSMTASGNGVMFRVPDGATDVYVILENDTTATYNLSTESTKMTITSVSPSTLPSSGTSTLIITGAGFGEECEVVLANASNSIRLQPNATDGGLLSIAVDCSQLQSGTTYDVAVTSGDDSATLPGAVAVTKMEGKGNFWVQANVPDSMREGRIATFTIEFGNNGNANCDAQLIVLKCKQPGALRKAGSEQWTQELYLVATGESQVGILMPGETGKVYVQYRAASDNKISVYSSFQDTFDPAPWGSRRDFLSDVKSSIEGLAAINADYGEWTAVYNTAVGMHNGSLAMVGGRVVDEQGEVVSNVPVLLQAKREDGESSYAALSDGSGNFCFVEIPPGRYTVCTGASYPHAKIVGGGIDADRCVALGSGDVVTGISVVVPNGVGLRIHLGGEQENCQGTACVTAGVAGLFGTNSIPAFYDSAMGCYFVPSVSTDVFWRVEARLGDLLAEKTVFAAGDGPIDVEMSLKPELCLTGSVMDFAESRIPDDDAYVIARMSSGSRRYIAEVSSNGLFSFAGLPAGRYHISLSGMRCSYEIAPEYDFSNGGDTMVELKPLGEDHELTVRHPTSWAGSRFIVIRNLLGVENAKNAAASGVTRFNRVEDGFWTCIVIDANGNELATLETEIVGGIGQADFSTRETLSASANLSGRVALRGWWGDVTDALYGYWKIFRDKAADWLAGCKWANTVIGWFQNGEYLKGRAAEEEALHVMSAYHVQTPPDCFCGYNRRKRAADGESVQNFAKVYSDFATFLSKCDNMKAVAMSFKTVGDSAETAMKYYMKKNAGGIIASLGEKWPRIGIAINTTKSWLKNHKPISAGVVYGSLTGQAIYDLIGSFDTEEIESCFSDAIRLATIEGDVASAISALSKASKYLAKYAKKDVKDALKKTAPEIAAFFDSISDVLDIILDVGQLLEDAVVTYQEWHQYENALSDFTTMYNWFIAEIERYRNIIENFNKYHGDECHQACPVPPDPPIEVYVPNIPRSYDPNEMVGSLGVGDPEAERFVKPGELLTYTVYFENQTNATAAAQEVYVTNPLSEWLDWSTFKMHEVAFGDQIDLGLAGLNGGTSEATMKGTNFLVRTELALEENGNADMRVAYPYQVRWYLRIVDPTTDTGWPTDIVAGFLPPNDETHRGEGHITYSIRVREDAPANVVITNSASIVFDYNDPIKTDPAWWNTVAQMQPVKINGEVEGDMEDLDLIVGMPYGELPTPKARKGYTFGGWFTGPNGTGRRVTAQSLVQAGDGGLYTHWLQHAYTVRFNANGGEGLMSDQAFQFGTPTALDSNAFVRACHDFTGWATNVDDAVVYADGAVVTNLTATDGGMVDMFATWVRRMHTVSFYGNDALKHLVESRDVGEGLALGTLPATPEAESGYSFAGWRDVTEGIEMAPSVDADTVVSGDMTICAVWTANVYTVTFDACGGTVPVASKTAEYGSEIGELPTATHDGYTFNGWFTAADGGEAVSAATVVTGNVTYYAHWTEIPPPPPPPPPPVEVWTVTFDAQGGDVAEASRAVTNNFAVGELPMTARAGYTFNGWFTAANGGKAVSAATVVTGNVTYYAHWTEIHVPPPPPPPVDVWTVTFDAQGGGVAEVLRAVTNGYAVGALPMATRAGYTFNGWFTAADGGEAVAAVTVVTGNVTYYAQWTENEAIEPEKTSYILYYKDVEGAVPDKAASVYDGYLYDDSGMVAGTVQAKVAKPKVNRKTGIATAKVKVTIQPVGGKKLSVSGVIAADEGALEATAKEGRALALSFGAYAMKGTFGSYKVDGARSVFGSKDAADKAVAAEALAKVKEGLNVAWRRVEGNAPYQTLSVTVAAKGKAKVAGTLADGTKVSAKGQLIVGEDWLCVPVAWAKKSASLRFAVWVRRRVEGNAPYQAGGGSYQAENAPYQAVTGLGGDVVVGEAGALKDGSTFKTELLPDGARIGVAGSKWQMPPKADNTYGLKLTYKAKDGSFKGSFKVPTGGKKSVKVNVTGVLVDGVGYGSAAIKNVGSSAVTIR